MSYLIHFNPNHDPKNGQFTFSPGDRVIKKGTETYRMATSKEDPVYDNKKYLSLTKDDHKKWQEYIGEGYKREGQATFNVMYTTTKDLRIAPYTKIGDWFVNEVRPEVQNQIILDTEKASSRIGYSSEDMDDMLSLNFAAQTESGKKFINKLIELGYDGIEDIHGRNTADDPVIVFNPEQNLRKQKVSEYK